MKEPEKQSDPFYLPRTKVKTTYQAILVLFNMIILMGTLLWSVSFFRAHEKGREIKPITPDKIREFGAFAGVVQVGLLIEEFQQFSIVNNQFVFDGILWFKFNPDAISIDTLQKFSFEYGTLVYRSPPDVKLVDEQLLVRYNIRLRYHSELDYRDFPLDDHVIYIIFTNRFIQPSEVIFKSSQREFRVDADMEYRGWKLADKDVESGYLESKLDPHDPSKTVLFPAIIFSLDYSRTSIRYTLSIILPLAIMFFLVLFSLSLHLRAAIPTAAGGITAILAYRFVIENLSPRVGFFMMSDFIFFLFLGLALIVFMINVAEAYSKWQFSSRLKLIILILFHIIVLGAILFLVMR